MGFRQKTVASFAAAGLLAGGWLAANPSAASAADGCGQSNAKTARTASVFSRLIELRANSNDVCAWGRISNGDPSDQVWVDRSYDGGNTWQQLSVTTITSGRDAFTEAFNDQGHLMRACGKAGNRSEIACTVWW